MVSVHYGGRLGNNMFQYALGRYLAEELGYELNAPPLPFSGTRRHIPGLSFREPHFYVDFFKANIQGILADRSNRMIILRGNFQLYEYYEPFMDRIREWFAFPPSLGAIANISSNDLLIYLRLGDYCDEGINLKFEFYEAAIKMAKPDRIFIVTEHRDHPFLNNFEAYRPIIVSRHPISDLAMANSFKKIVISCSTFAWWAVMLSHADEIYFPIGDDGHWSLRNMQPPIPEIDLRVDDSRFIYFYNCAVSRSDLYNTTLTDISKSTQFNVDLQRFRRSILQFHKKSKAYWFNGRRRDFNNMTHTEILNLLSEHYNYHSYLELGEDNRIVYTGGRSEDCSVDAVEEFEFQICNIFSDTFFESNTKKFDLIFIDGLHHAEQVYKDIVNSLKILNQGGTIVCHDINPSNYEEQVVPRQSWTWTGDCWKAWVRLRTERADLDMKVVDTDYGCGIIQAGKQSLLTDITDPNWNDFVAHRTEWLNLISTDAFVKSIADSSIDSVALSAGD